MTAADAENRPEERSAEQPPEQHTDLPQSSSTQPAALTVEARAHGWRLDHYLSRLYPDHSRARIQKSIEQGLVRLNGLPTRSSRRLRVNDRIDVLLEPADRHTFEPEDIPLDVLYEDEWLVVINKPAGMIVHPGRGSYSGTMAAALQYRFDRLSDIGGRTRPGIVHRLDRDTTGVILVAKDNRIHQKLSRQFEERTVRKHYTAIVRGVPELHSDVLTTHVCVHTRIRERMMVCAPGGRAREAVTYYETAETFGDFALMDLYPRTGRTHQLRVHMLHIGTPIISDSLYTGESQLTVGQLSGSDDDTVVISRQALHARTLQFCHPATKEELRISAPVPEDMSAVLSLLRERKGS